MVMDTPMKMMHSSMMQVSGTILTATAMAMRLMAIKPTYSLTTH